MIETTSGGTRFAGYLLVASIPLFMGQAAVTTVFGWFEELIGVPPQVLLIWIALGFVVFSQQGARWLITGQGRLPVALGLMTIFAVLVRDRTSLDFEGFRRLMQVMTGIAIYVVTMNCVNDPRFKRAVLGALFFMTIASAGVAIAELALGFRVPWSEYSGIARGVPVGLENSPVPLSYALVIPTTTAIVALFSISEPGSAHRFLLPAWLIWGTATAGFIALIATASRSGTAGVAFGSACGILMLGRGRNNLRAAGATVFATIALVGLIATSGVLQHIWKGGVTGDSRLGGSWVTYIPIIVTHPLGLPQDTDPFRALKDAETILGFRLDPTTALLALENAPHHFLLTAGLSYGWIAMIALVVIYYGAYRQARLAIRRTPESTNDRLLVVALLAATIALIAHSFFHNGSLLQGEMRNWIGLGVLNALSIQLLAKARQKTAEGLESSTA